MKKIILIALVVVAATSVSAQKYEFGVKGGVSSARWINQKTSSYGRMAAHFGLFAEKYISKNVAFRPELLYSMQGGRGASNGVVLTDKIDYINIPLIFKFYLTPNGRFSIDCGPQVGFVVSAKVSNGIRSVDIINNIDNKFDFALALGFSYAFGQDNKFDISFRDTIGFISCLDSYEFINTVTQISLGYKF